MIVHTLPAFDRSYDLSIFMMNKLKRRREATSVGILKGTCTLKWVLGGAQYHLKASTITTNEITYL